MRSVTLHDVEGLDPEEIIDLRELSHGEHRLPLHSGRLEIWQALDKLCDKHLPNPAHWRPQRMRRWLSTYWKWPAAGLGLIGLSVVASFLPLDKWVSALSDWVETLGPFGIVVFALVYAAATVLFIPGSLLTIAAGLIFGIVLGTLAAWTGAVLGSSVAFLVARYLARSTIEAKAKSNERFRAIDDAIGKQGWKIIGLLRLSPLIPFNVSNYFYGITKVGFWPYVLASAGGMLPGTLLYVYLGAAGKAGLGARAGERSPAQHVFFGVGLLATVGVSVWVSRIARRALKQSGATQDE